MVNQAMSWAWICLILSSNLQSIIWEDILRKFKDRDQIFYDWGSVSHTKCWINKILCQNTSLQHLMLIKSELVWKFTLLQAARINMGCLISYTYYQCLIIVRLMTSGMLRNTGDFRNNLLSTVCTKKFERIPRHERHGTINWISSLTLIVNE